MDPKNRRWAKRIPVSIPAGIYLKDRPHEVIDAEILSISEGGAFLHCNSPIELGTEVLVEIRFAETKIIQARVLEKAELGDDVPESEAEGSVVQWARSGPKPGFGIRFVELRPDKKAFLVKLLQYFEKLEKAGVTVPEE